MRHFGRVVLVFITLAAGLTHAQDKNAVRITSFAPAGPNTRAAELCGVVAGATERVVVQAIVDYRSRRPASYYLLTGKDGGFCGSVITYYGNVAVGLDPAILPEEVETAELSDSARRD